MSYFKSFLKQMSFLKEFPRRKSPLFDPKKTWSDTLKEISFYLVLIFLIRTFGFGLYQVPTGSMEPTLLVGERFFADKFTYLFRSPKKGEIISFNDPVFNYSNNRIKRLYEDYVWGPSNWTKRVIATPGQTVEGKIEDGKPVVYVDGVKLDEPYVNPYPLLGYYSMPYPEYVKHLDRYLLDMVQCGRLSMRNYESEKKKELQNFKDGSPSRTYDPAKSFENQPFYRFEQDRIIRNEDGELQLKEPHTALPTPDQRMRYRGHRDGENYWTGSDEFHVKLGSDQYWVMGDNRLGSHDCRFFGPINTHLIHGRIVFRIWSLDSEEGWWIFDLLRHPIDFWTRVRWSRCMQTVS